MIVERARQLRHQVEILAETLDDTEALEVTELFPKWVEGTSYELGARVRYNDILYKCLITHTAQSD